MAQNPFYPGYTPQKPGQSSSNPFFSGYYPGKKITKKPIRSGGAYVTNKNGFSPGQITEGQIDDVLDALTEIIDVPNWVKVRMADDTKSALKVRSYPPKTKNVGISESEMDSDMTLLTDEYETTDAYGAGYLELNVDPREWKKQGAQKMIKKTLTGWAKSVFNSKDFENFAAQEYWKNLLTQESIKRVS